MQTLDGHVTTIGNPDDWEGAAELGQAEEFMDDYHYHKRITKKDLKSAGKTPHQQLIKRLKKNALKKDRG